MKVVYALLAALNAGVHPVVFQGGSVGQADLSEMAQVGRALLGLGEAEYGGRHYAGAAALAAAGLGPLQLRPKEALGLISANGVTLGQGSLVLEDLADLLATFDLAAALVLEGFGANVSIIHPAAARLKRHAGQRRVADRLRALLPESYLWQEGSARNLQDPLSFRCMPQTHGACVDAYEYVRSVLEAELNAASDNPLVSIEDDVVISVGNFDITGIAVAFDMLRIALAQVIQLANERVQKQVWSHFSDLPTGLRLRDEPVGGLYPLARICASLAAEAQVLANPVSLAYRAQLAEGIEDHASMAPLGIRQTASLLQVGWRLAALEMIVAARAIDLRGRPALGRGTQIAYDAVRMRVPLDTAAGEFNVERVAEAVASGELLAEVRDISDDRLAVGCGPRPRRHGPHPGGLPGERARDRHGDATLSATA